MALRFIYTDERASLVTGSSVGELCVFEPMPAEATLKRRDSYMLHKGAVRALDVRIQGAQAEIASVGEDGVLHLCTVARLEPCCSIHTHQGSLSGVQFTARQDLITVSSGGHVSVWDRATGKAVRTLRDTGAARWYHSVTLHPTQPHILAVGASQGCITIWDQRQPAAPVAAVTQHTADVWQVQFHPSEPHVLLSAGGDGRLLRWDCNPRRQARDGFQLSTDDLQVHTALQHEASLNSFDLHRSLNTLLTGSENEALFVLPLAMNGS